MLVFTMNILNPLYWLSLQAANIEGLIGKGVLIFFVLLILAGIVCRALVVHTAKDAYVKMILKRITRLGVSMGSLGIVLAFFSYEGIRFFGARFWYVLWAVIFIGWVAYLVRFFLKDVPQMREKNKKEHLKSKYLPGRKK